MEDIDQQDKVSARSVKSTHKHDAVKRLAQNKMNSLSAEVDPQLEQMGILKKKVVDENPALRRKTFLGRGKKKFDKDSFGSDEEKVEEIQIKDEEPKGTIFDKMLETIAALKEECRKFKEDTSSKVDALEFQNNNQHADTEVVKKQQAKIE